MPAAPRPWLRRARGAACIALAWLAALSALPVAAQAAAPANDDFASAQVVRVGDRATGTLVDATSQAGEPDTTSSLVDHTIWFSLTPATTERLRLDTCGGNPYSELDVFTGESVDALTQVVRGDYGCTSGGRAYLDATAGTTYYIRVSGYDFGAAIALTIARPQLPANDDFADAQTLGLPATIAGTNVDATTQPGEPEPHPYGAGHSVWYRFTATGDEQPLTISLADCGSAAGSVSTLAVYTGSSLATLAEVGDFAPACGFRNKLTLWPTAGTTYRIAVVGGVHTADAFTLTLTAVSPPPAGTVGPPQPNPKCPFELAAPGSVTYSGTVAGGGEVCVTVEPGFAGVSWFNLVNPPRDLCIPFAVEHYVPALTIVARRFGTTTSSARVTGTFGGRAASGTFQAAIPPGGAGVCSGRVVAWTATTRATPPPSISDETPPVVRVRGAATQYPLRSGAVKVEVRCPQEACAARASATIAGVALQSAARNLRANVPKTLTLRLSTAARRAIRRALRARRGVRPRVKVVAVDIGANTTTARRTVTLRM